MASGDAERTDMDVEDAAVSPERQQQYASQDIAMLADFVATLSRRVQALEQARSREAWWQFWRPKPCSLDRDEHLNIWSITRDIRNYRDPGHKLQRFWSRGSRWYV